MKKLLLLSLVALGYNVNAQEYWIENATGFSTTSTAANEIRYIDANNIWVAGSDGSGGGEQFRVMSKSTDSGDTWTVNTINIGSEELGIGTLWPVNTNVGYIAAFPDAPTVQGGVFKTTNGGTTWTKQPTASYNTGTESFTNVVYFWDDNNGVTAGDPASGYFEIYTTTNGGTNWTRVPSTSIPAPLDGEFGYTRIFETVGDIIWMGTNKGRLYKSINRGLTWTAYQTPNTDFGDLDLGASFTFFNATDGLMIGKDFTQYRTFDGGVTWSEPEFPDGTIRNGDVTYVPGMDHFLVCIGDTVEGIATRGASYSADNGLSWTDIGELIDAPNCVEFYDATHGLAGGFTASATVGGIYKWLSDLNLYLASVDFQSAKAITASPNPTSGILDIAGKNISNVTAFDVLGKQVASSNYASMDKVTLNLSGFNSGIYMVKVTNNVGATSTIKVVKQ